MPTALITGASAGLGEEFARQLAGRGADLVLVARSADPLEKLAAGLRDAHGISAEVLTADLVSPEGLQRVVARIADAQHPIDLLVNNASALGAEPLVRLDELPLEGLRAALETNVVAVLGLVQGALPLLRISSAGAVINLSSDAAVKAYETWGGYGASKAALDQLSAVLAEEEPGLRVWAVDPGDMDTDLYRAAVPDDGDRRPEPGEVVPAFLRLLDERPAGGRYAAPSLVAAR